MDKHAEYLERIGTQTEKLLQQVDDMLNVTKAEAGELAFHFEITSLLGCIQDAAASIQAANPGRTVDVHAESNLPQVNADVSRIGQVVTNLLSNAIKYSPAGAPVKISIQTVNDHLKVSVSDHGIGIPQDKLKRVFDRFYRVESLPNGKFDGLGLGLFIAAEIIRKHHGQLHVESEEGRGSVFSFVLPLPA